LRHRGVERRARGGSRGLAGARAATRCRAVRVPARAPPAGGGPRAGARGAGERRLRSRALRGAPSRGAGPRADACITSGSEPERIGAMPRLERPDGVEIHWEEEGEGPLVVLSGYWSLHPSVFAPITDELRGDHRVVRYDDRGTGGSTHAGPYDLETASSDLEAVVEAGGGPAVIIG